MTLTLFALTTAVYVLDEASRRLAALVSLAMQKADITQDYVSRCTGIPAARLSDQLAGKAPFTGLCRILANDELRTETDLWLELTDLFAGRVDRMLAPLQYADVIERLKRIEDLIGRPRRMARMALPKAEESKAS